MSLIKDDEFIVIHIDENSKINDTVGGPRTEYIQLKTITKEEQKLLDTPEEELVNRILDEIIQDVVEEFKKNDSNVITEQPRLQVNRESQTDVTYNNEEQVNGNIKMSIQELEELKSTEEYNEAIRQEEEPCLQHYRPRRRNQYRKTKLLNNKSDCLAGLKRFIKYVFNF
tara:strand:- start:552 stop:1061 length:510 start_codon:yes stop_codon:yes gene_type:complete